MGFSNVSQVVNDVYLVDGNDFVLSSTNDLLLCNGSDRTTQRIIRRLITNPLSYIWHTDYGAGIPLYIGQPVSDYNFDNIKTTITSQIFLEKSVSQNPQPQIFLQSIQFGLFCQINYTFQPTGKPIVLSFGVE